MRIFLIGLFALIQSGCLVGEGEVVYYHTVPTKPTYVVEPVHVEVVYFEEDNHYYEFYNHYGEWCYGEYDWDIPDCFVEWCYDHAEDWWYEWTHYCQYEPTYVEVEYTEFYEEDDGYYYEEYYYY